MGAMLTTAGFALACGGGGRSSDVSEVCLELIACMQDVDPTMVSSLEVSYGEDSTCWDDRDQAAACEQACTQSLAACEDAPDSGDTNDDDTEPNGREDGNCDDGRDNDGDGDEDCDDSDCEFDDACVESDCGDGEDNDNDGDVDCDDRDCNGENECDVDYFRPAYLAVGGGFGYNASTGKVQDVTLDGEVIDPHVTLWLLSSDQQDWCTINVSYTGSPRAIDKWSVTNDGYSVKHAGISLPNNSSYDSACDGDFELDPDVITVEELLAIALGTGVGQQRPDVADYLETYFEPADLPYYGGGGMELDADYLGAGYSLGFEVDSSFDVITDSSGNGSPMLASGWVTSTGVPSKNGYYQVYPAFLMNL